VRRRPEGAFEISWDPGSGVIDRAGLEGVDAVIHLAGENIAKGRWTPRRKELLRESRVEGTRLLSLALASLERRPRVLLSASAVGYYGDRGDEAVTESSAPGAGFLPELCHEWEAATLPARDAGIRVVLLRTGVVLSRSGGALRRMLPSFRLGAGAILGSGRQFMSWISLGDIAGVYHHALVHDDLSGPLNAVSPSPVTNGEFTRTLARLLRRPAFVTLPAVLIRALFGELGQAALLEGVRVIPERLERSGYRFAHPDLESALRRELSR
jgi:uncharacterized protein (TIGR01777 family)